MKYIYPAIFEPAEEGCFNVTIPDIPGCFTFGSDMADAIEMAKDCLEMMLVHYEDEKKSIPPSSDVKSVDGPGFISYILADTDEWRRQFDNRSVKKNLTIPHWLNALAEKAGVNFSQVLQDALKNLLGVSAPPNKRAIA